MSQTLFTLTLVNTHPKTRKRNHAKSLDGTRDTVRKRGRPRFTCTTCRRKKLKCDGLIPCARCTQKGIQNTCVYQNNDDEKLSTDAQSRSHVQEQAPTSTEQKSSTSLVFESRLTPIIDYSSFFEEALLRFPLSNERILKWILEYPLSW